MQSIIQHDEEYPTCYLCGRNGCVDPLEKHHVFEGTGLRPLSEKYGLTVHLCHNRCHQFGPESVHQNIDVRRKLQAEGQLAFQEHFPDQDFVEIFGKNYIY